MKTDGASIYPLWRICLIYCAPTCTADCARLAWHIYKPRPHQLALAGSVYVRARVYKEAPRARACFSNQCVHRPLFQHHWASPLSQHKGRWETSWEEKAGGEVRGEKNLERQAKSGRMCVSPSSFKEWQSERYRVVETFSDCGKGRNEGDGLAKLKGAQSPLSLYGILI